jgi:hypothetical protein
LATQLPGPGPQPQSGATQQKSSRLLMWILIGVAVFFVLIGTVVVGGFLFVASKVKQAGFDPEQLEKNPAMAMTKMLVAINPELELVSVDELGERVTIREKATGKTLTVGFDDIKAGRIKFEAEDEDGPVRGSITAGGQGLEIQSEEGTMRIGAGSAREIPAWVPRPPDVNVEGTMVSQTGARHGGMFTYQTSQSIREVVDFFSGKLKEQGIESTQNVSETNGQPFLGLVSANADGRNLQVQAARSDSSTAVTVIYSEE